MRFQGWGGEASAVAARGACVAPLWEALFRILPSYLLVARMVRGVSTDPKTPG